MNYLVRDAIAGLAMDEAFWAKNRGLTKTAKDGASDPAAVKTGPDDAGFITIGGVRIPRSVVYGLALGGLGGGLGGVAGGMDGKTLALLALLGAAGGGALGYGAHMIDRNTAAEPGKPEDRVTAREQEAAAKQIHNAATESSGALSNAGNMLLGNYVPSAKALGVGVGGQALGGYMLGAGLQAGHRASKLNDLLTDPSMTSTQALDDKGRRIMVTDDVMGPDNKVMRRSVPAPDIPLSSKDEDINKLLGFKRGGGPTEVTLPGVTVSTGHRTAPRAGAYADLVDWARTSIPKHKTEAPANENWMRGKIRKLRDTLRPIAVGGAGLVTDRPRAGDYASDTKLSGLISRALGRPDMPSTVPVEVREALGRNFGLFGRRNILGGLAGAAGALALPTAIGLGPAHSALFARPRLSASLGIKK